MVIPFALGGFWLFATRTPRVGFAMPLVLRLRSAIRDLEHRNTV